MGSCVSRPTERSHVIPHPRNVVSDKNSWDTDDKHTRKIKRSSAHVDIGHTDAAKVENIYIIKSPQNHSSHMGNENVSEKQVSTHRVADKQDPHQALGFQISRNEQAAPLKVPASHLNEAEMTPESSDDLSLTNRSPLKLVAPLADFETMTKTVLDDVTSEEALLLSNKESPCDSKTSILQDIHIITESTTRPNSAALPAKSKRRTPFIKILSGQLLKCVAGFSLSVTSTTSFTLSSFSCQ